MTSGLAVCKIISPEPPSRPYFLMEYYPTVDGIRSRICEGRFSTQERAERERDFRKENPGRHLKEDR